ncbi:MAG: DUF6443 domain-containing protein [Algibacter sp.]
MKKLLFTLAAICSISLMHGQTTTSPSNDENYVRSIIYQVETTTNTVTDDDKIESITYFDGLGRPKQSIGIRAGGDKQDIITPIEYDAYGRQIKDYLPYALSTTTNGEYIPDALDDIIDVYSNSSKYENTYNPYSKKRLEASPLGRVLEQAAPGYDWRLTDIEYEDPGHTIRFEYLTNTHEGVDSSYDPINPLNDNVEGEYSYYNPGELYKTITKDENWQPNQTYPKNHTTEEFKNKQGQVVLKRTYATSKVGGVMINTPHDTNYKYDDFGNLTDVYPPKVLDRFYTALGYHYIYDSRNRLIQKKIPGKDWEYIVYDKLDRPVLTQDANLRVNNKWLFTKYDVFGRVTYTGIYTYASLQTQSEMQANLDTFYTTNSSNNLYESKLGAQGSYHFYSNTAFPNTGIELLTVNYYDNYTFSIPTSIAMPSNVWETGDITSHIKSLATGSKVKVLETSQWITSITAYDEKAQPIWRGSYNDYLKTTDIVKSKLDFVGKVTSSVSIHKKLNQDDIVTEDTFDYDHVGRLLAQTQSIRDTEYGANSIDLILDGTTTNNQIGYTASNSITIKPTFIGLTGFSAKIIPESKELIVLNTYDELGQLENKKVGGDAATLVTSSAGLQTVDYTYNIRGWLKQINNPTTLGDDLFAFKIGYNEGVTPLYNGNISLTQWKTANTDTSLKTYDYTYDALNRITSAIGNTDEYDLMAIGYDRNGNITNLKRRGHTTANPVLGNSSHFGTMDDLSYDYDDNLHLNPDGGNKLIKVSDAGDTTFGFKDSSIDDQDFLYDANGNMTSDDNKGISNITYNHLNLPTSVSITGGTISYIYDATGIKLEKKIEETGETDAYTYYAGNYIYQDSALKFFNHPEGYTEPKNENDLSQGFNYVYQYKDHLGNVRLSYMDSDGDGDITASTEILEENNYYPFGLKHKGYNNVVSANANSVAQKYKYNGKELNDELGLDWYDYGARNYDASLGRWMNIDPLAKVYYSKSPYNYALNSPIVMVDPDGTRVYFVIYTGGSADAEDAARTRREEIEGSDDFNSEEDVVYSLVVQDLGKLGDMVSEKLKDAEKNGFGKTVEASFYGHNGGDGPVGSAAASSNSLADVTGSSIDGSQLSPSGWKGIDFNFDESGSIACFYGCEGASFAERFLNYSNVTNTAGSTGRVGGSYTNSGDFSAAWFPMGRSVYFVSAEDGKVLPTFAFSADSPFDTYTTSNGITKTVTYKDDEGNIIYTRASNVKVNGNATIDNETKEVVSGSKQE